MRCGTRPRSFSPLTEKEVSKQKERGWSRKLEGGATLPGDGSMKGSGGYESREKPALRNTLEVLKDGEREI